MNNRLFSIWFAGRGYTLAILLGLLIRARMHTNTPLCWKFLSLVVLGMILRVWAGAHLGSHGNAIQTQSPTLCTSGPYRYSRNPLYIANILTGTGLILFANCFPVWIAILISIVLINHHLLLIHWEEKQLLARWGDSYENYLRSTSRWLGRPCFVFSGHRNPHPDPLPRSGRGSKNSPQWNKVSIWQGRNLGYTILSVIVIWIASKWR